MLGPLRQCRAYHRRLFHDVRVYKHDERWPGWQIIIGIETHAQIKSRQKLFSEALTSGLGESPNVNVSPFDAAFPGTLPKLNQKCVDLALRTAVALRCEIQQQSSFDRKHYFYSDLPSGYQITQQYAPIARSGNLSIATPGILPFSVRVKQIQLEQDTGKSTHDPRRNIALIDLNRAGTGLMEIVSEPDMRSPEEAGAYVKTLQSVLRAVGASDGNMEEGSFRCDVNVSVNRVGQPPGTRCEIKNLNSVRFMMAAIKYEIERQREIIESADDPNTAAVPQETRGWDEWSFKTFKLRSKEDAPDYRYMPDPNLGTLILADKRIQKIRETLPELPWDTRNRLKELYGLSAKDIDVLLVIDSQKEVAFDGEPMSGDAVSYFDSICNRDGEMANSKSSSSKRNPKMVANWMLHELMGQLGARKMNFRHNPLSSAQLGGLIDLVADRIVTRDSGKLILGHMLDRPSQASARETAEQLEVIAFSQSSVGGTSDAEVASELERLCHTAISEMPQQVTAVKEGHKNVLDRILGRVMKDSRGRADPLRVRAILEELILKD